jgi:hypothetical protein
VTATGVVLSSFVCGCGMMIGGGAACGSAMDAGALSLSLTASAVASGGAAMFRVVVLDTHGASNVFVPRVPAWV